MDIQVFGFISEFCRCVGLLYMPKLGQETGTQPTFPRSFTVFATVIGEFTLFLFFITAELYVMLRVMC